MVGRLPAYVVEWVMLTAARVGEVIEAQWKEIDLTTMTWNVPAEHLKTKNRKGKARVTGLSRPITSSMLRILKDMQAIRENPSDDETLIFMSALTKNRSGKIASQTLIRMLRRNLGIEIRQRDGMDQEDLVNHAFRTTLLDWMRVKTDFTDVVWRAQVDHELGET